MANRQPAVAWPPPKEIPPELLDAFTMNGIIPLKKYYLHQRYSGAKGHSPRWERQPIEAAIAAPTLYPTAKRFSTYGEAVDAYVESAFRGEVGAAGGGAVDDDVVVVDGGVGLVLGSENPWLEIILARAGAKHVVTIEYGQVESQHPRLTVVTPASFAAFMLSAPRQFDFAATFSSIEHSGLGRYGDELNPYGDLEAAAETWCALRPGGYFFLGLPSVDARASKDVLYWNAHRYYGPLRLAQIFRGYRYVRTIFDSDGAKIGSASGGNRSSEGGAPRVHYASLIHVLQKPL
jgi:hypothetical protein